MIYVIPDALDVVASNLDSDELAKLSDGKIYTQARHDEYIELRLRTEVQEWLWMENIYAKEIYVRQMDASGETVFEKTYQLDDGGIEDIWGYFYSDLEYKSSFLTPIFVVPGGTIDIKVSGFAHVGVGQLIIGKGVNIGRNEYEASVGLHDYSKITVDDSGEAVFNRGKCSSIYETKVYVDPSRVASTKRKMQNVRGMPVLWIGSLSDEAKVIYGYFKGFDPVYKAGGKAIFQLEIEGVV